MFDWYVRCNEEIRKDLMMLSRGHEKMDTDLNVFTTIYLHTLSLAKYNDSDKTDENEGNRATR